MAFSAFEWGQSGVARQNEVAHLLAESVVHTLSEVLTCVNEQEG